LVDGLGDKIERMGDKIDRMGDKINQGFAEQSKALTSLTDS
jgi:hypothetical protein